MAPQPVSNPERRFVLTRLSGGVETNVAVGALLASNFATDATQRATALAGARSNKLSSPGDVFLLYGPSNGGAHTDRDRIWDSRIKQ